MPTKIDFEDLRAPDTFHTLSERGFRWIEANAKVIAAALAFALLSGLSYITYGFFTARAERIASEDLYRPLEDLRAPGKPGAAPVGSPESALESALRRRSASKVSAVVAMEAAEILFDQKKFDDALKLLEIPTYRFAKSDVMAGLYSLHRGLAEMETSRLDAAIATFTEVAGSGTPKEARAEALLKLGLCLEQKKDFARAREVYGRLAREYPDLEAASAAGLSLRALDLDTRTGS